MTSPAATGATISVFSCNIISNRVSLTWSVERNQVADQFIVEKSTDGKNYVMAALVFGTDKEGPDEYKYFEKAGKQRAAYRIRLISKDDTIVLSESQSAVRVK